MQGFVNKLRERFRRSDPLVVVGSAVWHELLSELAARGRGFRESGAFLLGPAPTNGNPRCVSDAVYYDDLDPTSLTGGISFSGSAYGHLWDECEERGLTVVADVHTHPGPWIGQSSIDRAHPMLAQTGHIALIVPDFAQRDVGADEVGVHQYLGEGEWRSAIGAAAAAALKIERRKS